ncbi:MAG: ABC transporter permease [Bacteroidia bacterium]|nr:ABC transporter permease [Bacteroidia bacterium]
MGDTESPYWKRIKNRFFSIPSAKWSLYIFGLLVFIGVFADFLANEKPIYCKYNGKTYWPVVQGYLVDLGWSSWDDDVLLLDWHTAIYESSILPLIPYSAKYIDRENAGFKKPFGLQNIASNRYRHWLGTDQIGRDIAAGMINGTRISLAVGLLSMLVASIIGISLGLFAGYYGDREAKVSRFKVLIYLACTMYLLFFLLHSASHFTLLWTFLVIVAIFLITWLLVNLSTYIENRLPFLGKKITIPVDIIVMRLIELINSFPALFTILAIVAIVNRPSIIILMMVIGFIRWTGIARFTRAEMLKTRSAGYITAAKGLGIPDSQIIWRQALPNALPPVLITIAFGIAGAILLESFLSFLGIGVDPSQVSWGSLLQIARQNFSNWWLALFPGIAIFIAVSIFNLIGDGLTRAMEG